MKSGSSSISGMVARSCSMTSSATSRTTAMTSRRFQRTTSEGTASERWVKSVSQLLRARSFARVSMPSRLMRFMDAAVTKAATAAATSSSGRPIIASTDASKIR